MIEGVDYFIHLISWPNSMSAACVTPNDDGTFSIFVNKDLPQERIEQAILHELIHIVEGHLFNDKVSIDELEAATHWRRL